FLFVPLLPPHSSFFPYTQLFRSLFDFRGVFEPLRDVREFQRVYVDPEAGTIVWLNGADLDPLVLYAAVTKQSVESLLAGAVALRPEEHTSELQSLRHLVRRLLLE